MFVGCAYNSDPRESRLFCFNVCLHQKISCSPYESWPVPPTQHHTTPVHQHNNVVTQNNESPDDNVKALELGRRCVDKKAKFNSNMFQL